MIERSEIEERAARDGVPDAQVWRDWMISHVLHALSTIQDEVPLTFYGGTALCRTWCPDLRYSEDVDLLVSDFDSATEAIPLRLRQLLRREFADLEWSAAAARDRMERPRPGDLVLGK
jgi:predicted nucleotidyltransferase component of viral defense system